MDNASRCKYNLVVLMLRKVAVRFFAKNCGDKLVRAALGVAMSNAIWEQDMRLILPGVEVDSGFAGARLMIIPT